MKFIILIISLISTSLFINVSAIEFETRIDHNKQESPFQIIYKKNHYITYTKNDNISDILQDNKWAYTVQFNDTIQNVQNIISSINDKNSNISQALITDLDIKYTVQLKDHFSRIGISHTITMNGNISNHIISNDEIHVIDMNWRNINIDNTIINGIDITTPKHALKIKEPTLYSIIQNSTTLSTPIKMNMDSFNTPITRWFQLYDQDHPFISINNTILTIFHIGQHHTRGGDRYSMSDEIIYQNQTYMINSYWFGDIGRILVTGNAVPDIINNRDVIITGLDIPKEKGIFDLPVIFYILVIIPGIIGIIILFGKEIRNIKLYMEKH